MKSPFVNRKKLIRELNQVMLEEYQDNQFEEHQLQRSYSAGIVDGLGLVIARLSDNPVKEANAFPISISFWEEDAERVREQAFDLRESNKLSLFYEEAL